MTIFELSGALFQFALMGPVRGNKKKRKIEKKAEENSLVSGSSEEGCAEWWDVLSKTVAGNFKFLKFFWQLITYCNYTLFAWHTVWIYAALPVSFL